MKPIVARDQVRLGLARCFRLALAGMSHRLFRAGITIAILALAVAFLTHMLAFAILERETRQHAYTELQRTERLGQALSRLARADARSEIIAALAAGDAARLAEYAAWSGASVSELALARRAAEHRLAAEHALARLPPAVSAVVLADQEPPEFLDALATRAAADALLRQLGAQGARPPLGDASAFRRLVSEEQPALFALAERIRTGHARAIAELAQALGGRRPSDWAVTPPPAAPALLSRLGFRISGFALADVAATARREQELHVLEKRLLEATVRQRVARDTELALGDIGLERVLTYVSGEPERAAWLADVLRAANGSPRWSPGRLAELSAEHVRQRQLSDGVGPEPPTAGGFFGMSARSSWLVALSFLVCTVGVANAMLMSVTERFTEIATMKCLGAMDGFVMSMFVFEAVIQGALGGAVGLVLGLLLALVRAFAEYGGLALGAVSAAADVLQALGLAFACGVLLSAIAAIGPSLLASRLAPMEAMRVD